ncbi:leucine-rich repeat-containing protein 7 [Nephila pilipes]|uniref:Leucine-rich repeat-containing protein 7 n=1 Tax=Nephila pilipes TaxID=299642 RepID=A0A8X6PGP8_NEPPI|nr:leucine-rich repeat-containing protein 7 [Nephila pilipes]
MKSYFNKNVWYTKKYNPFLCGSEIEYIFIKNDFSRKLEESVDITYEPTYPIRNPDLKNDWRGKKRLDIQRSAWVEKKDFTQSRVHCDSDILYTDRMQSCFWRRHGQSNIRNKSQAANSNNKSLETDSNCSFIKPVGSNVSNSCLIDEEEYWDEDLQPVVSSPDCNSCRKSTNSVIPNLHPNEDECWDDDLHSVSSKASSLYSPEKVKINADVFSDLEMDSEIEFPDNFKKKN